MLYCVYLVSHRARYEDYLEEDRARDTRAGSAHAEIPSEDYYQDNGRGKGAEAYDRGAFLRNRGAAAYERPVEADPKFSWSKRPSESQY